MRTAKIPPEVIERRQREEQRRQAKEQLIERLKGRQALTQQDKDDLLIELARQHGLITK
ncbi:MAG: hypothetical protein AB1523_00335 [Bacillota bacterium]